MAVEDTVMEAEVEEEEEGTAPLVAAAAAVDTITDILMGKRNFHHS